MVSITPSSGSPADSRAALERELRRVDDRLRSLALKRLSAPLPRQQVSVAQATWTLAQLLADAAAGIESRSEPHPPAPRALPTLREHALADQLAVVGTDVVLAAAGLADDVEVWDHAVRRPLVEVLAAAAEAVVALRRVLP